MEDTHSIHLRRLHGQFGDIVYQLTKIQFSFFSPPKGWSPPINAYRCDDVVIICVDLAGVAQSQLQIEVESGLLRIRGLREAPEPDCAEHQTLQVLAMEIDYGHFEREISLPSEVDRDRVKAEHKEGLLWIYLPLRAHS
jgi:HSP20 family protein